MLYPLVLTPPGVFIGHANSLAPPLNCGALEQVVLSKLRAGPIRTEDVPAGVAVATVAHSPLSSLYHTLKDVYSPLIKSQTAEGVPVLDKRLSELLAQVQAGLGTAVRKGVPVRTGNQWVDRLQLCVPGGNGPC